jgi:hypothetical protein
MPLPGFGYVRLSVPSAAVNQKLTFRDLWARTKRQFGYELKLLLVLMKDFFFLTFVIDGKNPMLSFGVKLRAL